MRERTEQSMRTMKKNRGKRSGVRGYRGGEVRRRRGSWGKSESGSAVTSLECVVVRVRRVVVRDL
jgi:hypothetical protein